MKSSNNKEMVEKLNINDFLILPIKPIKILEKLKKFKCTILDSFYFVLISGIIFTSGIFIVNDLIYNIYFEQLTTFIFEQITSSQLFGQNISRFDYVLFFINSIVFIIKAWIFFSILNWLIMFLFKEKSVIAYNLKLFSLIIFPFSWIIFFFCLFCGIVLKIIFPFFYHYIFYFGLGLFFLIIVPILLQKWISIYLSNDEQKSEKYNAFTFKQLFSYYLILTIIILLWSYNHPTIFMMVFF
ncbi:MAG: hypothetical protein ACP6IY_19450 [Promethearchaeia archaeon]